VTVEFFYEDFFDKPKKKHQLDKVFIAPRGLKNTRHSEKIRKTLKSSGRKIPVD
jgi:hypothetical protein